MSSLEENIASTPLPLLLEPDLYVGRMPNFDLILMRYFPAIFNIMKENATACLIGKNTYIFKLNDGRYFSIEFEDKAIVKLEIFSTLK